MKKLLILLTVFCFSIVGKAQNESNADTLQSNSIVLHLKNDVVFYEDIVTVDSSLKKDYLFGRAKLWLARKIYDSKADVINIDMVNGNLVGTVKYNFSYKYITKTKAVTKQTFEITVKDGKYRIQMYDFKTDGGFAEQIDDGLIDLTKEYKKYLKWGKKGLPILHRKYEAFKSCMETVLLDFKNYMKENKNDF